MRDEKKAADMDKPVLAAANPYQGKAEKVTDSARIAGLLTRLLENRSLLSISVPESTDSYNSAILEVHAKEGYLVIDEVNPRSGHGLLLKAGRLGIRTQLKGIDIRFEGLLESSGESEGTAFYRIVFPAALDYRQQRAHYRARVSMARPIEVVVERANSEQLSGYLNDISVGGIGIRFADDLPASLARGERIPQCHIHLPTGEDIFCKIEIRFTSVSVEGGCRMIGARFIQLSPAQEAAVARYVAALDREFVKRMPRE